MLALVDRAINVDVSWACLEVSYQLSCKAPGTVGCTLLGARDDG